jgi:hypothetical protein
VNDALEDTADGKRFITDIRTVSRSRGHLGDLDGLAASIAGVGLRNPIIVTPGNQLISGYRRLKAAALLGTGDIPVRVASCLAEAVDLIITEDEDRTWQEPMAAVDLIDFMATLKVLRRSPRMNTVREAGNAILGYSYSRYCLIQRVVEAANSEADADGPAHLGLAQVDGILTGHPPRGVDGKPASLKEIAARLAGTPPTPRLDPVAPVGRRPQVRHQAKALSSAIAGLNGLTAGLTQVEAIDPAIRPADADRWVADINRAQRALRTLAVKLKEHSDAHR